MVIRDICEGDDVAVSIITLISLEYFNNFVCLSETVNWILLQLLQFVNSRKEESRFFFQLVL